MSVEAHERLMGVVVRFSPRLEKGVIRSSQPLRNGKRDFHFKKIDVPSPVERKLIIGKNTPVSFLLREESEMLFATCKK